MTLSSTEAELAQSCGGIEDNREEDPASRDAIGADAPDLEAMQEKIMVQIQHKLSQKEESLWRRGQVEIKRLQTQQKDVTATLSMMQERQETLVKENQKMRGALMEVTTKFEQVVKQMREVLRALPQAQQAQIQQEQVRPSPSPSEASTAASGEAVREEQVANREEPTPASGLQASVGWFAQGSQCGIDTPISMWHGSRGMSACGEESAVPPVLGASCSDSEAKYFSTPPRGAAAALPAEDFLAQALPIPGSWGGAAAPSPAVLSLASAIPSSVAPPVTPSPSPGLAQRLHLAEWLPEPTASGKQEPLMPTPPLPTRQSEVSSVAPGATTGCPSSHHSVKIELNKEPGFTTLGIEVNHDDGSLKVEYIDEHGFVGHYNKAVSAEEQANKVCVGDRMVEVNGIRDAPRRMLHECKVSQRLVVVLERKSEAKEVKPEAEVLSSSTKLRPDAQVFVPSAQKESQVPAAEGVAAPPGLEQVASGAGSQTDAIPDSTAALALAAADEVPEPRRALFH